MKTIQKYDHYYLYSEIVDIIDSYIEKYPDVISKEVIAKTEKGRDMLAVTITNTKTGKASEKPAFCVDANIHAGEVTGSMVAMYLMDVLMNNQDDKDIKDLLDHMAFYIIPRISPDGSDFYLTNPEVIRSVDRMYPYSSQKPGLVGCDLDGDGVIRKMRVKSPYGIWKKCEEDDRIMIKRRPDEIEGEFYNIFTEGVIEDYQGGTIKMAPGLYGNDYNRNFPTAWGPETSQRGAGKYPLSNVETKAMADFVIEHPNIGSILNMHTMGGQILYPPGLKASKEADPMDMKRYKEIGQMGVEENGFHLLNVRDEYVGVGGGPILGLFDDFNHFGQGLVNFTIECWNLNKECGIDVKYPVDYSKETDDIQLEKTKKYMAFIDNQLDGQGVKAWTKFDHPQLGEVEIGGIDYKSVVQNVPIKFLEREVSNHTRFILRWAKTLPRVIVDDVKVEKVDGKTYKVEATVLNKAYLPTYITKEAIKLQKVEPIKVTIENDDITILNGKKEVEIGQLGGFSTVGGSNGMLGASSAIMEDCEKKVTWIIQADNLNQVIINVSGTKIGSLKSVTEVK